MIRRASVIAMGLVLFACGGDEAKPAPVAPTATTPPSPPATVEAPKEEPKPKETLGQLEEKAGRAMVDAMNAHDAKKLAGLYTDSAIVKVAGAPDSTGRDAIAASYQKLFDAFPDFKTGTSRVFVKNDVVVVEWAFNGTHQGDLFGIKGSEKKVGCMGVDVLSFTPEGHIKEQHTYYDAGTIFSQIGVSKQKARAIPTLPTGEPKVVVSKGEPDETKNLDVVKTMNGAMEGKKEADFLGTMADTIEWDDMSQPQTAKGKPDAKKFMKEMNTAFPDYKNNTTSSITVGEYVITEGNWTGTHKAAFFGIPASKKSVNVKSVDIMQFKDGKLVKGWGYSNGADFMMQIGAFTMPKPPAAKPGDAKKPDATAKPADAKPADPKKPAEKK